MKKRNSNLEFLRIISMLLIVLHHYSVHGNWNFQMANNYQKLLLDIISIGGKIGVNIFVLISGYFLIQAKFNLKKLLILLGEIFFYSCSILLFFGLFLHYDFTITQIMINIFPTSLGGAYWFATTYVILYLLFPYLNILIHHMSQQSLKRLLTLLFVLLTIIPGIKYMIYGSLLSSSIAWFVFLYTVASYIRIYVDLYRYKMRTYIFAIVLSFTVIVASFPIIYIIKERYPHFAYLKTTYLIEMNTLPVLIISICLFLIFARLDMGTIPWINVVAKTTFAVYLIHDNQFVRPFLWNELARNASFLNSKWFLLHIIFSVCVVFSVCCIIELLRLHFIEPIYSKLLDRLIKMQTKKNNRAAFAHYNKKRDNHA